MSTPFTDLSTAEPSDKTWANEIIAAWNERRAVLEQDPVAYVVTDETKWTAKAIWLELQTWLETYCTFFVSTLEEFSPLNADATNFLFFTIPTWRAAAGLSSVGFTRYVNSPDDIQYGKIQASDCVALVNFEELQKGLSALKCTIVLAAAWVAGHRKEHPIPFDNYTLSLDWGVTQGKAIELWVAAGQVSNPTLRSVMSTYGKAIYYSPFQEYTLGHVISATGATTCIPAQWDELGFGYSDLGIYAKAILPECGRGTFYDNGLGLEENKWFFAGSVGVAVPGTLDQPTGWYWPYWADDPPTTAYGFEILAENVRIPMNWNFTNSN